MLRALSRVEQRNDDIVEELDALYSFFQSCWHLKDWLKNDDTLAQTTRDVIVSEAEKAESLNYCADLANGSKHLKLDHARKGATLWRFDGTQKDSDRSAMTITRHSANADVLAEKHSSSGEATTTTMHYVVASTQGTPFGSPVGLARRAVQDWKDLLKRHGLQI